jgi:hypothetical protein
MTRVRRLRLGHRRAGAEARLVRVMGRHGCVVLWVWFVFGSVGHAWHGRARKGFEL